MSKESYCGYVAIVGRPNVGKSTLLNNILEQKITIVSPKPQTTREAILGIKTQDNTQTIYLDTPGLSAELKAINARKMAKMAINALHEANVIVMLVAALLWQQPEQWLIDQIKTLEKPVILAINKIDRIRDKSQLLPHIEKLMTYYPFAEVVPISALTGSNVKELEQAIERYLPKSPFLFPRDQITDRSERFLAAEIIREKLFLTLQQELPYRLEVHIEIFQREGKLLRIEAVIEVEKPAHKAIVIGEQGSMLKKIGREARLELEQLFSGKIFLKLWVKLKK